MELHHFKLDLNIQFEFKITNLSFLFLNKFDKLSVVSCATNHGSIDQLPHFIRNLLISYHFKLFKQNMSVDC